MSQTLSRRAIGAALVSVAMRFKGVREEPLGSNSGPQVRKFQAATPLAKSDPSGWPWCAAYLAYIFDLLWRELGIETPAFWNPSASCDVLLSWARQKGILYAVNPADAKLFRAKVSAPQPYDVFLSMKSAGDATHTGLVTGVQNDLDIETIEGNTNDGGAREGIGVFTFTRGSARREEGRCYVRWLELLPSQTEVAPPAPTALLPGAQVPAVPTPPATTPTKSKPRAPRLIIAFSPYQDENYIGLSTAQLSNGVWSVDGTQLSRALPGQPKMLPGRAALRDHLKLAGLSLDETRTRLGNHTADASDPRQYAFIASGTSSKEQE